MSIPPAPEVAPAPAKPKNTVALVALIVAIVGFVFACVPGALIVGWVLLPIAFVLSLVALFRKGGKGKAVAALILSIVGTVVGVIVFIGVVAHAASDALGGGKTTVVAASPAADGASDASAAVPAADAADGSREHPVAIGSTISGKDWTVVVTAHNPDAADAVQAGNEFNDPAPAGSHYETVTYTVTYTGHDSGLAAEASISLVTDAGNVINSYDNFVLLADAFGVDELYNGASATGSVAFVVPDGQSALIRVRPGMIADEVFVQP